MLKHEVNHIHLQQKPFAKPTLRKLFSDGFVDAGLAKGLFFAHFLFIMYFLSLNFGENERKQKI